MKHQLNYTNEILQGVETEKRILKILQRRLEIESKLKRLFNMIEQFSERIESIITICNKYKEKQKKKNMNVKQETKNKKLETRHFWLAHNLLKRNHEI